MGKPTNLFTPEQLLALRQNPYVFCVTESYLRFTRDFKWIFWNALNEGKHPKDILQEHGFDTAALGEKRIKGITYHIRKEYREYGEFHEGNLKLRPASPKKAEPTEKSQIKQLKNEIEYLKQEVEFLKKISSIKNTRK